MKKILFGFILLVAMFSMVPGSISAEVKVPSYQNEIRSEITSRSAYVWVKREFNSYPPTRIYHTTPDGYYAGWINRRSAKSLGGGRYEGTYEGFVPPICSGGVCPSQMESKE